MTLAASAPPTHSRLRWVICGLAFLATLIIYSDRQFLSLVRDAIGSSVHWDPEHGGAQFALAGSLFLGAYACGLLFFGWYIDQVGVKIGYATCLLVWSCVEAAHIFAGSVGGLYGFRIALGLSEGGNFPAAIKAVAQWFPRTERAFATAILNSGANVGAVFAPPLVAWLLTWSWKAAFLSAGGAGLIWFVIWCLFYQPPEKHPLLSAEENAYIHSDPDEAQEARATKMPWTSLFGYRQAWSFIVAKFLTDPVWFFFLIWLPDFFKTSRGLDIKHSWPHLMTVYGIVTVLSLCGSWLTGHLVRSGWTVTRARKTGMFGFALLVLPVLFIGSFGNWTAVLIIGLAGAAHQSWSANLFTTVSDMFPRQAVGSITGMGSTAGAIGSMIFIYICGRVLDAYKAAHGAGGMANSYEYLFGYCAFAYLIAFGLQHLLAPKFEPVEIEG